MITSESEATTTCDGYDGKTTRCHENCTLSTQTNEPKTNGPVVMKASTEQSSRTKVMTNVTRSHQIPKEILEDTSLNSLIKATLPENYSFEVHKIIWRIRNLGCKKVGLQFPEGLFIFSIPLTRILESFTEAKVITFGDVTYGACCVDDYTAVSLGCDLLVHFAHSCLVNITNMTQSLKMLYVFVEVKFDIWHLVNSLKQNLTPGTRLAMASTVQFLSSIHSVKKELDKTFTVSIPQSKGLSKGEVLGCTASKIKEEIDHLIFVADGRFHLEAVMIANPNIDSFLRYNPYNKELTRERYDFDRMVKMRTKAIAVTTQVLSSGGVIGFLLGSLGRQGSLKVYNTLRKRVMDRNPKLQVVNFVIPEISPAFLNAFGSAVDAWVQVACPRLSIDWGEGFVDKPLLTPFELSVALDTVPKRVNLLEGAKEYPMDFYARDSLGDWTPNHDCSLNCSCSNG